MSREPYILVCVKKQQTRTVVYNLDQGRRTLTRLAAMAHKPPWMEVETVDGSGFR